MYKSIERYITPRVRPPSCDFMPECVILIVSMLLIVVVHHVVFWFRFLILYFLLDGLLPRVPLIDVGDTPIVNFMQKRVYLCTPPAPPECQLVCEYLAKAKHNTVYEGEDKVNGGGSQKG
jgi:hypothetical protein